MAMPDIYEVKTPLSLRVSLSELAPNWRRNGKKHKSAKRTQTREKSL